jgi:hypothetical protein
MGASRVLTFRKSKKVAWKKAPSKKIKKGVGKKLTAVDDVELARMIEPLC